MTAELTYLVWSALLCLVQAVIAVVGAMQIAGLPRLAGNRDEMPPIGGWAGRAERAHRNMLESLGLFAIFVLAAHLSQRTDAITALGAAIFFWARVAYLVIYLAGIPWLRTGVWAVSIVGMLMVARRLV